MFIIFDLDGTLALNEHRQHFLEQSPKDWDGFYNACDQDSPNLPVVAVYEALMDAGNHVEIWSGRSESVREKTFNWFEEHYIYHPRVLRLRPERVLLTDQKLKEKWLFDNPVKPDLIIDDRDSMVKWWRSLGYTCIQVAEGDF